MSDPGVQFEEVRDGKRRWFEPRFTLGNVISIVTTGMAAAALYYSITGSLNLQASEIDELKATVAQVPSLAQHVAIIDNTINLNKQARDRQSDDVSARLDALTITVNALAQNVAALTATIKAQENRP
jgi:hypothetical protein